MIALQVDCCSSHPLGPFLSESLSANTVAWAALEAAIFPIKSHFFLS